MSGAPERDLDVQLDAMDLGAVEPREFARIVKRTPARKAAEVMAGPHRGRVLDELFRRMETLFRPEAAGERVALVRWRITRADGPYDVYETYIADGRLTVTPYATDREPRLTLTLAAPDLLRLASGNASGPALFLLRKVRAHGDLRLAARLTELFEIPRA